MQCTNCGHELMAGAEFCGNCGAKLIPQPGAPAPVTTPTQVQPGAAAPAQTQSPPGAAAPVAPPIQAPSPVQPIAPAATAGPAVQQATTPVIPQPVPASISPVTPQPTSASISPVAAVSPSPTPAAAVPGQQVAYAVPIQPKNGLAIASLVLGIIAVLTCLVPGIGLLTGVPAIIMGAIAHGKGGGGKSLAGLITGAIGSAVALVVFLLAIVAFTSHANALNALFELTTLP